MRNSSYIEPVRFKEVPVYDENGNLDHMELPKFTFEGLDTNTIDVSLPLDLNDPVNLASVSASSSDLVTPVDVDALGASQVLKDYISKK